MRLHALLERLHPLAVGEVVDQLADAHAAIVRTLVRHRNECAEMVFVRVGEKPVVNMSAKRTEELAEKRAVWIVPAVHDKDLALWRDKNGRKRNGVNPAGERIDAPAARQHLDRLKVLELHIWRRQRRLASGRDALLRVRSGRRQPPAGRRQRYATRQKIFSRKHIQLLFFQLNFYSDLAAQPRCRRQIKSLSPSTRAGQSPTCHRA